MWHVLREALTATQRQFRLGKTALRAGNHPQVRYGSRKTLEETKRQLHLSKTALRARRARLRLIDTDKHSLHVALSIRARFQDTAYVNKRKGLSCKIRRTLQRKQCTALITAPTALGRRRSECARYGTTSAVLTLRKVSLWALTLL